MIIDTDKICIDKKINNMTSFQSLVFKTTLEIINLNDENNPNQIKDLLKNIGEFAKVDRVYLFAINHEDCSVSNVKNWDNKNVSPLEYTNHSECFEIYSGWIDRLINHEIIQVDDVTQMSIEASKEQQQLLKEDVKSVLAIPITDGNVTQAFIRLDLVNSFAKWTEENIEEVNILGKILLKGLKHLNNSKKESFISYHDPITELPNRSSLTEKLQHDLSQAKSQQPLISILFINLDGFKVINDTFGYKQGNALLKQVSKRLVEVVSENDVVSRTDSDQFIVYVSNYQNLEHLDYLSLQIIKAFNTPFILRGEEYNITASMGVSRYQKDGDDVEELIRYAYMAMNKAKCLGKNQYQNCTTQIKEEALEIISLTNDLYKAIERNELLLHYQSQVEGTTGKIVGVEALLRWNHPKLGFVPPFKFIPLAEKTQLILSIGYWVLENAVKQFRCWQEQEYNFGKIAVNFSVYQLRHPRIIQEIKEILEKYALDAKYLEIEITESLAMDRDLKIRENLEKIKQLGVSLSIDDFGKEYSSFNRLKESPIDTIKIDMSFVQGIGIYTEDEGIVRSVLSLAGNLGLKTIAEGVETKEQADFLNNTACDYLQGYYFHRPMASAEIEKLFIDGV